jgi:hypothetical protein
VAIDEREAERAGAGEVHRRVADGGAALVVEELRDPGLGRRARKMDGGKENHGN